MDRGFLYYFTGGKNAVQLLVSIYSLRQTGHKEPVLIACGDDEAVGYAVKICGDDRIGPVSYKRIALDVPPGKGKGRQHCAKSSMGQWSEFSSTIFLDADTCVTGALGDLWPAHSEEVVLTRFASWVTTGGKMVRRLSQYRDILPDAVAMMVSTPYPAINTGILSWGWNTRGFHDKWKSSCLAHPSLPFMGDEITANLVFPNFPHRVLGDLYNFSPVFSIEDRNGKVPDGIKVWHFHGKKHLRKGPARETWTKRYKECVDDKIADIQKWTPARDRDLRLWLEGKM